MNIRLAPIVGITGLLSIALASSAVAGGGGWPLAPGAYRTTDVAAYADLSGPPTVGCVDKACGEPSAWGFLTVDRGLHTFKPKSGTRVIQQDGTIVTLDLFGPSGPIASGCWMIADGDFVVSKDLSSARLATTVPAASNCPGTAVSVSPENVVKGMGGGAGGGASGPLTLNLQWTYRGVVTHSHSEGLMTCGGSKTNASFDLDNARATSQGQISAVDGLFTSNYSWMYTSATKQLIKGVPGEYCF